MLMINFHIVSESRNFLQRSQIIFFFLRGSSVWTLLEAEDNSGE